MNKVVKLTLLVMLILVSLVFCYGCKNDKEENLCQGKVCIECGEDATHYVSGAKPAYGKANEKNCEQISSYVYRIFYCDACWEKVPKAELSPN